MVHSHNFLKAVGAVAALALTVTPLAACGGSNQAATTSAATVGGRKLVVAGFLEDLRRRQHQPVGFVR